MAQVVQLVHGIALVQTMAEAAQIAVMLDQKYIPAADAIHPDGLQRLLDGRLCGGKHHIRLRHFTLPALVRIKQAGSQCYIDTQSSSLLFLLGPDQEMPQSGAVSVSPGP